MKWCRSFLGMLLATWLVGGCTSTGRSPVEVPLHVAGTASAPIVMGDYTLTLERADVAIGPLWLCAAQSASVESCETALLEYTATARVDALAPAPESVGMMQGVTGTLRSAMFDYGISWLAPSPMARAASEAPEGHSAVFRARVVRASDGSSFGVAADVDVVPSMAGAIAVPGRRVDEHTLVADVDDALIVRVDAARWWSRLDLARLAARADAGEDPVVLRRGDPDYEALLVSMSAGALPTFEWAR